MVARLHRARRGPASRRRLRRRPSRTINARSWKLASGKSVRTPSRADARWLAAAGPIQLRQRP
eukprot:14974472-Alexandrium_andersonii.AAC.1